MPSLHKSFRWLVLFGAMAVVACASPLPAWDHPGGGGESVGPDAADAVRLSFDPSAPSDQVTRVTRIALEVGGGLAAPRVMLVEGTFTAAQLRDLARPAVPQTLAMRALPSLVWIAKATTIVVAPLQVLAPAKLYTVGVSEPPIAVSFTVAANDKAPILSRVWPDPAALAARGGAAVWCGREALADLDIEIPLAPSTTLGRLGRGTGASLLAAQCASWFDVRASPDAGDVRAESAILSTDAIPVVPPPYVAFADGTGVFLEPFLLWPDAAPSDAVSATCETAEIPFGPACATALDDRIVVRPPMGSVLWTIDGGETVVRNSRAARSFVLRPLPADLRYRWATLDESGRRREGELTIDPAPPRSHLVINEVMSNPAGVERNQEWVELVNDGGEAIRAAGHTLETGGRITSLPDTVIPPGAFALVVPDGYVADDGVDPVPAAGTLLLRVPALGRDGLSNDGDRLLLRDPAGALISAFPAMKAKNGVANARVAPDAPDGNDDSFVASPNGTATPGAPNATP